MTVEEVRKYLESEIATGKKEPRPMYLNPRDRQALIRQLFGIATNTGYTLPAFDYSDFKVLGVRILPAKE